MPNSRNPYQVIATYDRRYVQAYGGSCLLLPSLHPSEVNDRINRTEARLPNAPMAASKTLLAQCLKAGLKPTTHIRESHEERRHVPRVRRPYQVNPKNLDGFKGRLLGIEIEYYPQNGRDGYELPRENVLLKVGTDGSLGDMGREIKKVTWQDSKGHLAGILTLKLKGTVDARCGLHVHVDVRHLGDPEGTYDRLTLCYPALKRLVPPNRLKNDYCRWGNNREGADNYDPSIGRYGAVNWAAYPEHGTLEFRCQCGMIISKQIEAWALVCQWITNWVSDEQAALPNTLHRLLAILPVGLRRWCKTRDADLHPTTQTELPL